MGQHPVGLIALGEFAVVARIEKVSERHARERGISEKAGAVGEPVLECLGQLVKVGRRSRAPLASPFLWAIGEDAEDFDHDRSAGRGRWHGKHAVAEEVGGQRFPLDRRVPSHVVEREHATRGRDRIDHGGGDVAAIEGFRACTAQPFQRRREGGACDAIAGAQAACGLAADGEDLGDQIWASGGIARDFILDLLGQPGRDGKSPRKSQRGLHAAREGQGAETPEQLGEPAYLARHADRKPALRPDASVSQTGRKRRGRGFAKIQGHCLACLGPIDEGETTAAQTRSEGVCYAKRQRGCTGRVDGIATGLEHFHARGGCHLRIRSDSRVSCV